jgi:DNA mismatch endonuclease, patch repair protein
MTDIFSAVKRSAIMRSIRSTRNASTEQTLAAALRHARIVGWRRHRPIAPRRLGAPLKVRSVKPEIFFPKAKLAMFLDGCFWHCCPIHSQMPKHNRLWWRNKLTANAGRDARNTADLRSSGWRVLRIWEHDLHRNPGRCVRRVVRLLDSTRPISTRRRQ